VLADITVMLLTFDEEANIGRTLGKLTWAKRILVIDSGSRDRTREIVAGYPQAEVIGRDFDSFAGQCNFGLDRIATEWVLSLDADYVLTDELIAEIAALRPEPDVSGYSAAFTYRVFGRRLHHSLYPPRTVLYRARRARYADDGHGHRVAITGRIVPLAGRIEHDDRKPLARWFSAQARYAALEAAHLTAANKATLPLIDRIRLMIVPAPLVVFLYTLIGKGCLLDGWPGWFYAAQRACAEIMLSLAILERRLRPGAD